MGTTIESVPLIEIVTRIPPNRRLIISGNLSNEMAEKLQIKLHVLQQNEGDILCTISCTGGHFYAGIALYDAFRTSPNRVIGKVDGKAKSAAFMALMGCQIRLATEGCELFIHNPLYYNYKTPIGYDSTEKEYLKTQRLAFRTFHVQVVENRETTIKILMERSHIKNRGKVEAFLDREHTMTSVEALSMGFVDAII